MYAPIFLIGFVCLTPESELRVRLQQRYEALAAISASYEHSVYVSPRHSDALDVNSWRLAREPLHFRVTISRPNVLVQLLDELPDRGYTAVDYHLCNDRYQARWVQPDREGRQVLEISEYSSQQGLFLWSAVLEVFELRIPCHPQRFQSLLTLLEAGQLEVLGTDGERIACRSVDQLEDGSTCEQYWEVDQTGFARHASAAIYPADPSQAPITSNWLVLATQDFSGVEVPQDVAVIVDNPNVAAAPGRTVQRITLTSIELADGPQIARICEAPVLCNANVTEYQPDGTRVRRIYDADGLVIQTDQIGAFVAGPQTLQQRKLAWAWSALPAAAAFTLIGFVALKIGRATRS
ncbi:MAG: hypothetical protein JNG88_06360 [Phycisphaerales bacterium]|nr:hypothetical protein [Phycisphaerales bacterium]